MSVKLSTDEAAGLALVAREQGESVSSLLRLWVQAAVSGRWLEVVDPRGDGHVGYVVISS